MNLKEKFLAQYDVCIDENGDPKACGRDNCMELIMIADELEPEVNHGNEYAFMNLKTLKVLHTKIKNS